MIGNSNTVYLIGIGGIGMSALARWFKTNGYRVGGYDRTCTELTSLLENEGIWIHYEDRIDSVPAEFKKEDTIVIYTPAVPKDHKELNFYRDNDFPVKKRSEVLGLLTEKFFTIAVAGTHGKTTTSSIVAHLLKEAGKNVFAFIGGITQNYKTNLLLGDPKAGEQIMVVEADEYDRSFLTLAPNIAIITSMDADHLDIYGNDESVKESFNLFADQLVEKGVLIYKEGLPVVAAKNKQAHLSFGLASPDYRVENISVSNGIFEFDIKGVEEVQGVKLAVPGMHNIMNAIAAFAAVRQLGIPADTLKNALGTFKGVKRRFEFHVNSDQMVYVDDYAHHPAEIEACLSAARALFPDKKITAIFQPHLFTRTRDFLSEFGKSLSIADQVILLPIYPAREQPIEGITSEVLLEKVDAAEKEVCAKASLIDRLKTVQTDVLLTIGAGDIDNFVEPIKKLFENEKGI